MIDQVLHDIKRSVSSGSVKNSISILISCHWITITFSNKIISPHQHSYPLQHNEDKSFHNKFFLVDQSDALLMRSFVTSNQPFLEDKWSKLSVLYRSLSWYLTNKGSNRTASAWSPLLNAPIHIPLRHSKSSWNPPAMVVMLIDNRVNERESLSFTLISMTTGWVCSLDTPPYVSLHMHASR